MPLSKIWIAGMRNMVLNAPWVILGLGLVLLIEFLNFRGGLAFPLILSLLHFFLMLFLIAGFFATSIGGSVDMLVGRDGRLGPYMLRMLPLHVIALQIPLALCLAIWLLVLVNLTLGSLALLVVTYVVLMMSGFLFFFGKFGTMIPAALVARSAGPRAAWRRASRGGDWLIVSLFLSSGIPLVIGELMGWTTLVLELAGIWPLPSSEGFNWTSTALYICGTFVIYLAFANAAVILTAAFFQDEAGYSSSDRDAPAEAE